MGIHRNGWTLVSPRSVGKFVSWLIFTYIELPGNFLHWFSLPLIGWYQHSSKWIKDKDKCACYLGCDISTFSHSLTVSFVFCYPIGTALPMLPWPIDIGIRNTRTNLANIGVSCFQTKNNCLKIGKQEHLIFQEYVVLFQKYFLISRKTNLIFYKNIFSKIKKIFLK